MWDVGDVGTEILVDCGTNIEGATDTKICMRKHDGTIIERDADIHAQNGLTEHLRYVIVSGDLDQAEAGWYKVQAKLTLSGWSGRGETDCFIVYDAFKLGRILSLAHELSILCNNSRSA